MLKFAVVFALVSGVAHAAAPLQVDVSEGSTAAAINSQLAAASENGFGGAVVVEMNGNTIVQAGYGFADRDRKIPFSADTTAQIGSITKAFTALAVSQLVAEGKLDLNVPVSNYLPDAAEPAASATLNQLLTHTAGLADYCGDDFDKRTKHELLTVCMAMPLDHPAGPSVYSNMGLSIAAAVVEQVSGQAWDDYLRDHIWQPFGMTHAGWTFTTEPPGELAVGYLDDISQGLISDRIAALGGADWNLRGNGGLQVSAADMQRFYHGLMSQPEAVRALMLKPHAPGAEAGVMEGYGLFFRMDENDQAYRVGHSGSDGVFFSYFCFYPQRGAFFYFVGNNGEDQVTAQLKAILKIVEDTLGLDHFRTR